MFRRELIRFLVLKTSYPKLKGNGHELRMCELSIETWKHQPDVFKFELGKFKMAGSGGSGHGRERSNSGRKRKYEEQSDCGKNHKGIYLESRIFQSWLQAKFDAGYESCSDSDCSCLSSKVSYVYVTRLIYILWTIYFTYISIYVFFYRTLENMARRSSGLSGFIEQKQLLSNVIESEDASKCYSFPSSALFISEVCDIEQLFPFSSGLQTSSPVKPSILFHICNRFHRADFSLASDLHGHPRQLFCFRFVLHALLHLQKLDTASQINNIRLLRYLLSQNID